MIVNYWRWQLRPLDFKDLGAGIGDRDQQAIWFLRIPHAMLLVGKNGILLMMTAIVREWRWSWGFKSHGIQMGLSAGSGGRPLLSFLTTTAAISRPRAAWHPCALRLKSERPCHEQPAHQEGARAPGAHQADGLLMLWRQRSE